MKTLTTLTAAALIAAAPAFADGHGGWTSVDDQSSVAFGSIKKDLIGEVHHFNGVTGKVGADGKVEINIDLTSVETYIDIRNERMVEHVFQGGSATAVLAGEVEMGDVEELAVGDTTVTDFDGTLTFGGAEVDVYAEMLVARLGEDRVLVTTADFIMIAVEDLGVTKGIDKLMELAKLPSITRVTPVSVRMVFEK